MTDVDLLRDTEAPAGHPDSGRDTRLDQAYALERMQLALDAGRTGVWDWNLLTGEVHLDARVRQLWGLADDVEPSFEIFKNAVHPQDRRRTKEAVGLAFDPAHDGDYEIE